MSELNRNEIQTKLQELLEVIEAYENSEQALKDAKLELKKAKEFEPTRMDDFDDENLEKYVYSIVGDEPVIKDNWNPLTRARKFEEAEAEVERYRERKKAAEEQYYDVFDDKRAELYLLDEAEKKAKIEDAEAKLNVAAAYAEEASKAWASDDLLPPHLRKSEVATKIMTFFNDYRADSVKEAINLYFDEARKDEESRLAAEHRERLEKLLEEQNETVKEALDYSRDALLTANLALDDTKDALDDISDTANSIRRVSILNLLDK